MRRPRCKGSARVGVRLQQDPDFLAGTPGPLIGTVHYSSYCYENITTGACFDVHECPKVEGNIDNNFTLIKINDEWTDKVHPAVLTTEAPPVSPLCRK